jgi:glutamyl-tRNA reductase
MRKMAKECSLKEIDRAIKKGYLPKEQKEQVEKILHSAFNNFLHKPTKQLKSIAQNPEGDMIIQSVQYFFDMQDISTENLNRYKCEYSLDKGLI